MAERRRFAPTVTGKSLTASRICGGGVRTRVFLVSAPSRALCREKLCGSAHAVRRIPREFG
jgi:hypothetical protein